MPERTVTTCRQYSQHAKHRQNEKMTFHHIMCLPLLQRDSIKRGKDIKKMITMVKKQIKMFKIDAFRLISYKKAISFLKILTYIQVISILEKQSKLMTSVRHLYKHLALSSMPPNLHA